MAYRIDIEPKKTQTDIINGKVPLTDAELEALKEEYRRKNAELEAAILDEQQAKAAWEQKAEQLDDVAKQGSNPLATNTAILEAFGNIDFSTLAKEQTLTNGIQSILTALNPKATTSDVNTAKQAILDALAQIQPEDPYSQALASFFNITPPVPNAVPMTQQEVEDDLDELWNLIITQ